MPICIKWSLSDQKPIDELNELRARWWCVPLLLRLFVDWLRFPIRICIGWWSFSITQRIVVRIVIKSTWKALRWWSSKHFYCITFTRPFSIWGGFVSIGCASAFLLFRQDSEWISWNDCIENRDISQFAQHFWQQFDGSWIIAIIEGVDELLIPFWLKIMLTESSLRRMSLPATPSRARSMLVAVPVCRLATKCTGVCWRD